MKHAVELVFRIALVAFIWVIWWWAINAPLSNLMNLSIIVGGALLMIPSVWLGRKILDRYHTTGRVAWITTFVHCAIGLTFGVALMRALTTHHEWSLWVLPVPVEVGLF